MEIIEDKQKNDEPIKDDFNLEDFIALLLLGSSIFFIYSAVVWLFTDGSSEEWFSRLSIGLICLGFVGVIFEIRRKKIR